jgi:hypothetical protein
VKSEIAPIIVQNRHPALPAHLSLRGAANTNWKRWSAPVKQLLKKQAFAWDCGVILFAFDEPQKITKKRLFRPQLAC